MAEVARGVFVALNGIDLSCVLKKISTPATSDLKDATTLCETQNKRWEKGQLEHTISGEGFFRASAIDRKLDANGLFKAALADKVGDNALMVCKDGASFGNIVQMYNIRQAKYEIDLTVNELLMATFEAKATRTVSADGANDGFVIAGGTFGTPPTNYVLLGGGASQNVAGAGAGFDFGAARTGYFFQIQCTGGDDSAAFTIQHSTNGSTWVDVIQDQIDVNKTYLASSTTTPINRYVRVNISPFNTYATLVVGFKSGYTGI